MIDRILYLLTALVQAVKQALRKKEQREAQDEREQIDTDSAQYSADKFGDGRVRSLDEYADRANKSDRADDNRG